MTFKSTYLYIFVILISLFSLYSCDKKSITSNEIMPSDDVRIGEAIDNEFVKLSDSSSNFNILNRTEYWKIYSYSDTLIRNLLNNSLFQYSSEFNWKLRIYDEPGIKNSFAAPGGYIYISKELILSLRDEAQFTAILAHAMLVSDLRMATEKLQSRFSISYLLDISIGGNILSPSEVFEELRIIPYSKEQAIKLDTKTADIICSSDYDIRKFSRFLSESIGIQNQGLTHEWLFHYPAPADRAETISRRFNEESCSGTKINQEEFEKIKISLDI